MDDSDSISGADMAAGFADGFGSEGNDGGGNDSGNSEAGAENGGSDLGLSMNMSEEEAYGSFSTNSNTSGNDLGLSMNMSEEEAYGSSSTNSNTSGNDLGLSMNMSEEEAFGGDLSDNISGSDLAEGFANGFSSTNNGITESDMSGNNGMLSAESQGLVDPNNPAFSNTAINSNSLGFIGAIENMQSNILEVELNISNSNDRTSKAIALGVATGAFVKGARDSIVSANALLNTTGIVGLNSAVRVGVSVGAGLIGGGIKGVLAYNATTRALDSFNDAINGYGDSPEQVGGDSGE